MNALDRMTDGYWAWGWLVVPLLCSVFAAHWTLRRSYPNFTREQRANHCGWLGALLSMGIGAFFMAVKLSRL